MPPDFLLRCNGCGGETIWDTEALPPVGTPEVGDPIFWLCAGCGREMRHVIAEPAVLSDKLHHEISLATELERQTVEQVMAEVNRRRLAGCAGDDLARRMVEIAEAVGVSTEAVDEIVLAEAAWMRRRGYPTDTAQER
jgi:hypothetical protein